MFEINLITIQVLIGLIFLSKFKQISNFINLFDYPDYKRKIHNKKFLALEVFLYFLILLSYCPATSFF